MFLIEGLRVIREKITPVWHVEDDPFGSRSRVDQLQHKTVFDKNVNPVCCAAFFRLFFFRHNDNTSRVRYTTAVGA